MRLRFPASAEGLDQGDQGGGALTLQLNDTSLMAQGHTLRGSHLEVGHQTGFVSMVGDLFRLAGGIPGGTFGLQLGGQKLLGGQLVFDLLKCSQHL